MLKFEGMLALVTTEILTLIVAWSIHLLDCTVNEAPNVVDNSTFLGDFLSIKFVVHPGLRHIAEETCKAVGYIGQHIVENEGTIWYGVTKVRGQVEQSTRVAQ